ncbi:MAG: hypothetical protein ACKVPX_18420 [Myxococcaceae bacterium]
MSSKRIKFAGKKLSLQDMIFVSQKLQHGEGLYVFGQLVERPHLIDFMFRQEHARLTVFGRDASVRKRVAHQFVKANLLTQGDSEFLLGVKRLPLSARQSVAARIEADPGLQTEYAAAALGFELSDEE